MNVLHFLNTFCVYTDKDESIHMPINFDYLNHFPEFNAFMIPVFFI